MSMWDHAEKHGSQERPAEKSPEKGTDKPATKPGEEVAVKSSKGLKSTQRDIMEFLQHISQKIKNAEPKHTTVADEIDAYIRDHGNRHPEVTSPKKEVL